MKRLLNLRNTVVVSALFVGLLFVTSSFSFGPVDDAQLVGGDTQKKEQRLKVTVSMDGKETKIDTIVNLPDQNLIDGQVDSMLSKLDKEGVNCKKIHRIMYKADKGRRFHSFDSKNFPGEQFDIMIENGDSGKCCKKNKVICVRGFNNESANDEGDEDELMPPPPPIPPHGAMMFHQGFGGDPFAFDTKDESVVSYEKKDIGNGLERITIVRKKHDEQQAMKEVKVQAEILDNALIKKKNDEFKALKKLKDEADAKKKETEAQKETKK